jgi:hypothetical protein
MNKFAIYIAYLTLILALGLTILGGYWLLYPYKPIVFNNLPFKVDNKIVKVGNPLTYTADYCKYSNLLPTATKSFVNQIIYVLPGEAVVIKPIGCGTVQVQITVPTNLPPGDYVLKITYHYQVNPIRIVNVYAQSEEFAVTK